jgi:hypothetical protein
MLNPYPAWKRHGDIPVTNPSSTAGVQAPVTIPWQPGMQPDFRDIRFSDIRGAPLNYWIESQTAGTTALVWVKLPANDGKIILYYGNGLAVNESNAYNTLEFYEPFANLNAWTTVINNGISCSGGILTISSGAGNYGSIRTTNKLPENIIITARLATRTYYSAIGLGANDKTGSGSSIGFVYYTNYESAIYTGAPVSGLYWQPPRTSSGAETAGDIIADPPSGYFIEEFAVPAGGYLKQRRNGGAWTTSTRYQGITSSECLHITHYRAYASFSIDYIYARKYTATEPTLALARTYPPPRQFIPDYPPGTFLRLEPVVTVSGIDYITVPGTSQALYPSFAGRKDILAPITRTLAQAPACISKSRILAIPTPGTKQGPATFTRKDALATITRTTRLTPKSWPIKEASDVDSFALVSIDIGRTAADVLWELTAEFAGTSAPEEFKILNYDSLDAAGTSRHLFTGISTETLPVLSCADNRVTATAYDYGWYLAAQYLPDDARVMNLTGTRTSWTAWIIYLLEGTGITPYRLTEPTAAAREFIFSPKTSKRKAIDDISAYYGYIFELKWRNIGTTEAPLWQTAAYWIPTTAVDDESAGLDLPAPVTFTAPDPYLVDLPEISSPPEEKINRVRIRGTDGAGTYYTATAETTALANGDDMAREYYEESSALTSQALVDARAAEMLAYFTAQSYTVRATFIKRYDLALYQQIKFGSGFPEALTRLTDGTLGTTWLRILEIRYHHGPAADTVEVVAVSDQAVSVLLERIGRTVPGSEDEADTEIDEALEEWPEAEIGTVLAISDDGQTATVETEDGKIIQARIVA